METDDGLHFQNDEEYEWEMRNEIEEIEQGRKLKRELKRNTWKSAQRKWSSNRKDVLIRKSKMDYSSQE